MQETKDLLPDEVRARKNQVVNQPYQRPRASKP